MIIRTTFKSIRTLGAAAILITAASVAPESAQAAPGEMTHYSTLGCVAKNPKQADLLIPNAKGLFNRSDRVSVVVLCPLQRTHSTVNGCPFISNHLFQYTAFFNLSPSVSGAKPGRMWVINTLGTWGDIEASQNANAPKPVIMRGASTPNPMLSWDGVSKHVTEIATHSHGCLVNWYVPSIRLQIPPKAYATAIVVRETDGTTNANGT